MSLVVVLYFYRLGKSEGGAERMLLRLASDLTKRGHTVHVVSWDPPDAQTFHHLNREIAWHRLGFSPGWRDKLRRTRALSKLLRQVRADVFVGFVMGADKSVYLANVIAGVPIVAAERNSPVMYAMKLTRPARIFYMTLFGLARRIVVQLETYLHGYPQWLRKRMVVISNPVESVEQAAQPAISVNQGWTLLCVGRLDDQKNPQVLLRAFAQLAPRFPDWTLRMVGSGHLLRELHVLADTLGISSRVQFAGQVSDVSREYRQAHLFCLPSRWEGFPNALAEAMAHGLPSVGFAGCEGAAALITQNVNGRLAEGNGNELTLADSLAGLMSDPVVRTRLGEAARTIVDRNDPHALADRWEALLEEVAGLADT